MRARVDSCSASCVCVLANKLIVRDSRALAHLTLILRALAYICDANFSVSSCRCATAADEHSPVAFERDALVEYMHARVVGRMRTTKRSCA